MRVFNFSVLILLSLVSCRSSVNFDPKELFNSKNGVLLNIQTPIYSINITSKDRKKFTLLSCDTFFSTEYYVTIDYHNRVIQPFGFYLDTMLEYSVFIGDRDTIEYLFGHRKSIADLSFRKIKECDFIIYEGNQEVQNKELLHFIEHFDTINLPGVITHSNY